MIGIEALDDERLTQAFEFCLTADARRAAVDARSRAVEGAGTVERDFLAAIGVS